MLEICKKSSKGEKLTIIFHSSQSQYKGKSSRVGRQVPEEPNQHPEDNHITVVAPFEIGVTMREEDLEEYGAAVKDVLQRLLFNMWDTETTERSPPL
ncbi:uncharacterized protein V6R79_003848 [Siganus canaliculatus]